VLNERLRDTALVFENIAQPGNVSACTRTAEALGCQHVFVVERYPPGAFVPDGGGADKGCMKWLTTRRFGSLAACLEAVRAEDYAVHATDLGPGAVGIDAAVAASLCAAPAAAAPTAAAAATAAGAAAPASPCAPATRPRVALAFGNEHRGCSRALLAAADVRFALPQRGLVQSLNLSVAAALALDRYVHRTPDYAARAEALLAAAQQRLCAPPLPPPAEAAAGLGGARRRAPVPGGGVVDVLALLQRGTAVTDAPLEPPQRVDDAGGAGAGGRLVCEGLPLPEKAELLARFLMSDVVNSERILARAGVRPDDY